MLPITKSLISNSRNRPGIKLKKLKGIIIHWTANPGKNADADAHFRYFQNNSVGASAHYFVDSNQIIQIIPDDEVAYHVGSRSYRSVGNSIRESGLSPNHFLIGIEMCINPESDWDTTYKNTVELTQHLMQKHNLPATKVWRHFDITGKDCPKMMCKEEDEGWARFMNSVTNNVFANENTAIGKGRVNTTTLNVRQGNGSYFGKVGMLKYDDEVQIFESVGEWYRIGKGQWVAKPFVTAQELNAKATNKPQGTVNVSNLNIRSGASTRFPIIGKLNKGDKVALFSESGDWYHIGDNKWIHKSFVDLNKKATRKGLVNTAVLNVRKGAGTNQAKNGTVKLNDEVDILEERNGWYRIGKDKWVYAMYILELIQKWGKITATVLNVRKGPGTTFSIVKSLNQNDRVEVFGEDGDWYRIGTDAWVHKNYVQIEQL